MPIAESSSFLAARTVPSHVRKATHEKAQHGPSDEHRLVPVWSLRLPLAAAQTLGHEYVLSSRSVQLY